MKQIDQRDVLIVGGGPAGMTAALWCAELKLSALLIDENKELGGQLSRIFNRIENYPGVAAANGRALCELFLASLRDRTFETRNNARVANADLLSKTVVLESGEELRGKAVIFATGVRRRKLGVEGEAEFAGRGIMSSGAGEREAVQGKRVVIVGGGDAALENTVQLSDQAEQIIVVHRREQLTARDEFVKAARSKKNVRFELGSTIKRIIGNEVVEAVEVSGGGVSSFIETDKVLIRIGVEPNSELLAGQVELDHSGYAIVDAAGRTTAEGVFIAGDLASPDSPTIATAVGMGATSAKAAHQFLASCSK